MNDIFSISIQSTSIQFLETLYILDNSKNIETIKTRIEFLETVTDRLRTLKYNPDFQFHIKLAIDHYSVTYYNRSPSEKDITRLLNPESFELESYCITSLINGLKRFFEEQLDEIEYLKSSSSKDKRISKVIHNILIAKNFLQMKFSESKSYSEGIAEIEKIIIKIKEVHETI